MRQDQTLQAVLRFGRDEEGAIVFAHTAALHEDLPVVGDGAVVRAFSESTQEVARTAQQFRDQEFTVSDLVDTVDCSRRTVRRVLAELSEMGYLERHDPGDGLANEYHTIDEPGSGDVELPTIDTLGTQPRENDHPGQDSLEQYYTWFVRVPSPQDEDQSQHGSEQQRFLLRMRLQLVRPPANSPHCYYSPVSRGGTNSGGSRDSNNGRLSL